MALKAAIAQHVGVNADNIIVGNGSTELIWLFAGVFIKDGDEALMPAPTFGEYEIAVRRAEGRPKFVKLKSDFYVKANDFVNRMNARTKIIFLCNPNNPTGRTIAEEELLKIVEEAERRDILVFIDEDFMDFVDWNKRFTLADRVSGHRNTFVLRSFTKVFGLAGIRVGYGVGCKEMIELLHHAKVSWNVNCLAQVAAAAALADDEYINETQQLVAEERAYLLKGLAQINGFKVFPTDANFVLINIRGAGVTAAQLKEKLLEHSILIRDCSSFRGLDKYFIRIAIRTRKENAKLLKVMQTVLGACSGDQPRSH
jgi:histidinol-phosphate aminotransferase